MGKPDQLGGGGAPATSGGATLRERAYELWWLRKRTEGCSRSSFDKHYGSFIQRLDPRHPFSDGSLMGMIESTDPNGPTANAW